MEIKGEIYTQELQEVLDYMDQVLKYEVSIDKYDANLLILSILSNEDCHAFKILENIFRYEIIEELDSHYSNVFKVEDRCHNLDNIAYSEDLINILNQADAEAKARGAELIGTEHVLLAILNDGLRHPIGAYLKTFGLNYAYLSSKCDSYKEEEKEIFTKQKHKSNKNVMKLKSEVNSNPIIEGVGPFMSKYTIDINAKVATGQYDNLVMRDKLINKIIHVLSRRKKNNVVLVGNPGVGSSSLVYYIADMINKGTAPNSLDGKQIRMLDTTALLSGTTLRGMFEERVDGLFKELTSSGKYILFIDNMQTVVRNGGKDKDGDLTDLLGPILSDGKVRVIATIPFKDYRNGIERSASLARKLQKIIVDEPSETKTLEILKSNRPLYERYHHIKFNDSCLSRSIKLAKRYITQNSLPDSAIDILDITGARISLKNEPKNELKSLKEKLDSFNEDKKKAMDNGDFEALDSISKIESQIAKEINDTRNNPNEDTWPLVNGDDIDETVSMMTDIPISKLKSSDKQSILNIENVLKKDVIGQDEAIEEIAKAIKRNRAGFNDKNKVYATFMLVSKTGCGKTLLAKKIAENIFGDESALIRFDMSEYQDKTSVNKLIGSSAGYVGYDNGGLLTEAIKNKPYCVLLFDEIEKADESVYNLFLQLFDEGRLTDNNGTLVNFKNAIIIMTSNIGAKQASELGNGVGFTNDSEAAKKSIVSRALKNKFNPEFINRIDKIIHMNSLTNDDLKRISKIELDKVCNRVIENNVIIKYTDAVVDYIYDKAVEQKEYGARPIMRIIQDNISDKIVDYVLANDKDNLTYYVDVDENNEIVVSI